jgi:hypothetical protein
VAVGAIACGAGALTALADAARRALARLASAEVGLQIAALAATHKHRMIVPRRKEPSPSKRCASLPLARVPPLARAGAGRFDDAGDSLIRRCNLCAAKRDGARRFRQPDSPFRQA